MGVKEDIETIASQERSLVFDRFDEGVAWALGCRLREQAAAAGWPVVVEVGMFHRPLFLAALPGSTADNVDWARRKRNVVERYQRSSYAVGLELELKGDTLERRYGLPPADYAAHGGAFPLAVRGTGVIGCAVLSGLPQREDHLVVMRAICAVLGRDGAGLEFEAEATRAG